MQQINEILINGAISILVIMLGIAVKAEKRLSKSSKSWPKMRSMP